MRVCKHEAVQVAGSKYTSIFKITQSVENLICEILLLTQLVNKLTKIVIKCANDDKD